MRFLELTKVAYQKVEGFLKDRSLDPYSEFKELDIQEVIEYVLTDHSPQIKQRIYEEFMGLGPLKALVEDVDIDEILVMKPDQIVYEKRGTLLALDDIFFSEHSYLRTLDLISKSFFKAISFENPTGNGHWGPFRVHIIAPPLTTHPNLSLRKKGSTKIKSISDLKKRGSLNDAHESFLLEILKQKKNVLVSGATSSGKTTFIQCLLNELKDDRCLVIEDAQELELPNAFSTRLLCPTRTEQYQLSFNISDLVKESLRMRPDRLILGEARGGEAKDYIQALSTGHNGCVTSIHAAYPQDALLRLECLILQGAPEWSVKVVRQLIHSSLDFIIQLDRGENGLRHIKEIHRIVSLEEDHLSLEPVFGS